MRSPFTQGSVCGLEADRRQRDLDPPPNVISETIGCEEDAETEDEKMIDLLDKHLATATDLQLRITRLLRDVETPQIAESWWLASTANEFERHCELIAARIYGLGSGARIKRQSGQAHSLIDPEPPAGADERERLKEIIRGIIRLRDSTSQARDTAAARRDQPTAKLLENLMTSIDNQIWFLGSPSV